MTEAEHNKMVALRQALASIEQQREGWEYFKRGGWAGDRLYELLADLQAKACAADPPLTGTAQETLPNAGGSGVKGSGDEDKDSLPAPPALQFSERDLYNTGLGWPGNDNGQG